MRLSERTIWSKVDCNAVQKVETLPNSFEQKSFAITLVRSLTYRATRYFTITKFRLFSRRPVIVASAPFLPFFHEAVSLYSSNPA
jgi:hypothetical protein